MHAFFVDQIGEPGECAELDKNERDHLFKTLRAVPGDIVRLLDGRGAVADARVEPGKMLVVDRRESVPEPALKLYCACAAPRKQKLDTLLKQFAELGVWSIDILHCERSVAQPEGSDRWQALLREGCKQSNNPFLPRIRVLGSVADGLSAWQAERVMPFYGAVGEPEVRTTVPGEGQIGFFVGPEGGFSDTELALLRESGAAGISLGPWILRLETAAICGIAALRVLGK